MGIIRNWFFLEEEMKQNVRFLHKCKTKKFGLQSELNESKKTIQNLPRSIEQDGHLWNE